ncbi:MAG TPA: cupin domain-containing protein [Thermoanaerobaculia bacterium]|nr:cupin domain-containing protein [Thermoanaerobaculia bacterium]
MILSVALLLVLADSPIAFTSEAVVWKDGPPTLPAGSKTAVLEGDPRAEGIFTMRVRVPAGATLAPHWHPRHERVTILSGAAELGFGSTATPSATKRYGAGSFYVNPPRTMHYLFFPEETVMQMTGIGPWEMFTTDVEAKPDAKATGTVNVRSIKPAAGASLEGVATIAATVDYTIDNFRPDTFHLSVQFESTTPHQTFGTSEAIMRPAGEVAPRPAVDMLPTARGRATVTGSLTNAARRPELKRPVRVKVYLHEATGPLSSRVVATTDWIAFR